jgi:3-deoxy-D-manno-octulosonic-acid transferase
VQFLYNLLFTLGGVIFLPFFILLSKHRREIAFQLARLPISLNAAPRVLFHCASVGEIIAARAIIEEIKKEAEVVISVKTEEGYHTAQEIFQGASRVVFLPLEFRWLIRHFLRGIKPRLILILETEFWPNFLWEARAQKVPVVLINGQIPLKSYRWYRVFRFFFKEVLSCFSALLMQFPEQARRVINIGAPRDKVKVIGGNLKFSNALLQVSEKEVKSLKTKFGISERDRVIVAGSTHRGEEKILLEILPEVMNRIPRLKLIIAPRDIKRVSEIEGLLKRTNFPYSCYSKGVSGKASIIILDTMGELRKVYALSELVFIGGSLVRVGGHNLIEPAAFKKAILFGPYMENFREIEKLFLEAGGALRVKNKLELQRRIIELLLNPAKIGKLGEQAFEVYQRNKEAVQKTLTEVVNFLSKAR